MSRPLLLLIGALLVVASARLQADPLIISFNPDVNTRSLNWVQATTQAYLRQKLGNVRYQPVIRVADFHRLMKEQPLAVIISAVFRAQIRETYQFDCVLIPKRGSLSSFRKVLITATSNKSLTLNGRSLAASVGGSHGHKWLLGVLRRDLKLDPAGLRIVAVSKDIDAIFALSFNQVDFALVSPRNIDVLRRINPLSVKKLRIIRRSRPIAFPTLCVARHRLSKSRLTTLKTTFLNMHLNPIGKQALQMMGFDRWVELPNGGGKK